MMDSDHDTFDYMDYSFKLRNQNILCLHECFCVFVAMLPLTLPVLVSCPVGLVTEIKLSSTAAIPDISYIVRFHANGGLDNSSSIIN